MWGEPIIIWPPNCGNFDDGQGAYMCPEYGYNFDCTDQYDFNGGYQPDSGLVCCM